MTHSTDAPTPSEILSTRWEREQRPHSLAQTQGEGAPHHFKLDQNRIIMGRAEDALVRIISPKASRQHALLERQGDEYIFRDNGSRNGILLNGLRIHSAVLRDGDVLQVGDAVFIYHEG